MTNLNENITSLYKNPFDDYNANALSPERLLQYWCNPFSQDVIDELSFYTDRMPIIIQGSRGSGKTTLLKYCSLPIQEQMAIERKVPLLTHLESKECLGFYFRCDKSFVDMFETVFKESVKNNWPICFDFFIELFLIKNLLELVQKLVQNNNIKANEVLKNSKIHEFLKSNFTSIDELYTFIIDEIRYINVYQNEYLFDKYDFKPNCKLNYLTLSKNIIIGIKKTFPTIEKLNFLLLIDEFENLPPDLQTRFNTKIKFSTEFLSLRIGCRSENIISKKTINEKEYLRQNADYKLINLDLDPDIIKNRKSYLQEIAEKRLELSGVTLPKSIIDILGSQEELIKDANEICKKNKHIEIILQNNKKLSQDKTLAKEIVSILTYPEDSIAEAIAALIVSRSEDEEDLLEIAKKTREEMDRYFLKEDVVNNKFAMDYANKYKYSISILLTSIYRTTKLYYSFNTIVYLSEGNTRTFINLCREIFTDALFYEPEELVKNGKISKEIQDRAIRNFSVNEFTSVCSIIEGGTKIKKLIETIGNIFSNYHKDKYIRYPETNQFYISGELNENSSRVLSTAESWSLIRKKNNPKRLSLQNKEMGSLYIINRIFCPCFNISYRIRGGYNHKFSAQDINNIIDGSFDMNIPQLRDKLLNSEKNQSQQELFQFDEDL